MTARWPLVAVVLVVLVVLPGVTLGVAVVATLGGAVAGGGCGGDGGIGGGSQQIGGRVWSAEQTANAHTLVAGAAAAGLPKRAAVIALSAAIVESGLHNRGDRGLLGPAGTDNQQRPSPGSGAPPSVLNPAAATDAFYTALAGVPHWATLPPGAAAAAVQATDHPERYAADEATAAALVDRFWHGPDLPAPPPPRGAAPQASGAELAGVLVPPACPDPGGSDAPGPSGPRDRSRLPGEVGLPTDPTRRAAVRFALAQVGRPYVFGAKGPRAFDCSGLTQAAWAAAGVGISAGTLAQIHDGTPVASLAEVAPGDLLFRPGSLGTPSRPRHVGLYAGDGVVVEAASRRTGVIVSPLAQWTATTVAIRRITGPPAAGPPAPAGAPAPPRPAAAVRAGRRGGGRSMTAANRRVLSPAADRDLLAMAGLAAFLAAVAVISAELVVAAGIAAALLGAPLRLTPADGWLATAVRILTDADDPGRRLGAPWSILAGHPLVYWAVAAILLVLTAAAVGVGGGWVWRRWGPTPSGHATRPQIRRALSPAAARRSAAVTRPGLSERDRARAPLEQVGAPLHRGPIGVMCSPFTSPTGVLAPTQSGKSRTDLVHKTLGAPGALLCSTTKPDLLEFAALARTRRRPAGPVLVLDATGSVAWPAPVRWSPISGCEEFRTAYHRAGILVEAAAVHLTDLTSGNDRVFRERARMVLAAYLLAAALYRRGVGVLVKWAIGKPPDPEPADLLEPFYPELARNLRAEIGLVAQTSDAVWLSVRRVIEPLLDPALQALCTPGAGGGFDARAHISQGGTLFLVAGEHQAAHATPILTALTEHWLTTAQQMALQYPTRRLDPPATAVLDELPNATPIPQLPDIISDSAGRGVIIHWAAQSAAQLEDSFTPSRARQLLDNSTTMTFWGGIKDTRTLEWISTLVGHHEAVRWQHHSDGLLTPGRSSLGSETVPTYRPGDVRTIERGRVLVVHANLWAIQARTVDVSARPDWPQLRADVDAVRRCDVDVDPDGFAIPAHRAGFQPPPILHT